MDHAIADCVDVSGDQKGALVKKLLQSLTCMNLLPFSLSATTFQLMSWLTTKWIRHLEPVKKIFDSDLNLKALP